MDNLTQTPAAIETISIKGNDMKFLKIHLILLLHSMSLRAELPASYGDDAAAFIKSQGVPLVDATPGGRIEVQVRGTTSGWLKREIIRPAVERFSTLKTKRLSATWKSAVCLDPVALPIT